MHTYSVNHLGIILTYATTCYLTRTGARFAMCLAPSKRKVLSRDWIATVPNLILDGVQLTSTNRFTYLGDYVLDDDTTKSDSNGAPWSEVIHVA